MIEMQKQEFEEQIFKLKQEIYVLQAKVLFRWINYRKKKICGTFVKFKLIGVLKRVFLGEQRKKERCCIKEHNFPLKFSYYR